MTKKSHQNFCGMKRKYFRDFRIFGIKSHEGNILVEMCSDEFLLKHALHESATDRT